MVFTKTDPWVGAKEKASLARSGAVTIAAKIHMNTLRFMPLSP
jgi:hypothetical protein